TALSGVVVCGADGVLLAVCANAGSAAIKRAVAHSRRSGFRGGSGAAPVLICSSFVTRESQFCCRCEMMPW
ncbi:hypothetical protein L2215_21745, partial [Xanthomonas perforans]